MQLAELDPIVLKTYKEAVIYLYSKYQIEAIEEEYKLLQDNITQDEVEESTVQSPTLTRRQVFIVKRGLQGEITRFKARQVVRGFEQ